MKKILLKKISCRKAIEWIKFRDSSGLYFN